MLKTNRDRIPKLVLQAAVTPLENPGFDGMALTDEGTGVRMSAPGGICCNVRVGDRCFDVLGVHIAPGVCLKSPDGADGALATYAVMGTQLSVIGNKEAAKGYIIGKCSSRGGGVVAAAFPQKEIDGFEGNEHFLIKSASCGLKLIDYPEILCLIAPDLLERMPVKEEAGRLLIPVAKVLPERFAGALGGDMLSIMARDKADRDEFGLDELRFGDFIMFTDIDATYGTTYLEGAVTIGVITDGDAPHVGGGPGVSVVFSCKSDKLGGYVCKEGNLSYYYKEAE